jgi:hypothetical protein
MHPNKQICDDKDSVFARLSVEKVGNQVYQGAFSSIVWHFDRV